MNPLGSHGRSRDTSIYPVRVRSATKFYRRHAPVLVARASHSSAAATANSAISKRPARLESLLEVSRICLTSSAAWSR
jgi:hypothetical protein